MVVIQDTRGRFDSDGEWQPFGNERDDGYDSVEWAARLSGSTGRVATFGASYLGNTQWAAATSRPPSLRAINPVETWSEPLDGLIGRGGALELGLVAAWDLETGINWLTRGEPSDVARIDQLIDDYDRLASSGYWGTPVANLPVLQGYGMPDLGSLDNLKDPAVADRMRVRGQHDRVDIPTFHIGGWYDIFIQGTLDNHIAMTALGRESILCVGPWTHDQFRDPVGDLCFGTRSRLYDAPAHGGKDLLDVQLSWFARHLREEASEPPVFDGAPVRIFVMGRNQWRNESSWPLARAQTTKLYLQADGGLSPKLPPRNEVIGRFTHDPAQPVPVLGGNTVMVPELRSGPRDQRQIESRSDVLTFTSDALAEDLEVTGRVRAFISGSSSTSRADWVVRVCDVHPDGRSINICDGIARVDHPEEGPRSIEIDLWSTSNVFLAGHRIRVQVTGSSFPRWDRAEARGDRLLHQQRSGVTFLEIPVIPNE